MQHCAWIVFAQLTFLMTSYGLGTGTSTFTGYGICCNKKITANRIRWVEVWFESGVETDLDHFVRLRNWYFHFVWNLAAKKINEFYYDIRAVWKKLAAMHSSTDTLHCAWIGGRRVGGTHLFDDFVWFWYVNFHLVRFVDWIFDLIRDLRAWDNGKPD